MEIFLLINCFLVIWVFLGWWDWFSWGFMDGWMDKFSQWLWCKLKIITLGSVGYYMEGKGRFHYATPQLRKHNSIVTRRCIPTSFTKGRLFRLILVWWLFPLDLFDKYILIHFCFSFFSFKYINNIMWCLFLDHLE